MEWFYADASQQQHAVPGDELPRLVASRRIRPETLLWNETMSDWAPAATARPDLFAAAARPPVLSPAERRAAALSPANAFPGQRAPTDSVAVCALVFGILGLPICLPILAIPAIVCGHIARRRARDESLPSSNAGLALAGLIMGYIGLACLVAVLGFYGVIFVTAITEANREAAGTP